MKNIRIGIGSGAGYAAAAWSPIQTLFEKEVML